MSFLFEPENLLPYDGIAIYHGVVFNEQEANGICKDLLDTIPWKQDEVVMFGKKIITKRKVAWYADTGICYTYAGVKKSGLEWTSALIGIKQKVEAIPSISNPLPQTVDPQMSFYPSVELETTVSLN